MHGSDEPIALPAQVEVLPLGLETRFVPNVPLVSFQSTAASPAKHALIGPIPTQVRVSVFPFRMGIILFLLGLAMLVAPLGHTFMETHQRPLHLAIRVFKDSLTTGRMIIVLIARLGHLSILQEQEHVSLVVQAHFQTQLVHRAAHPVLLEHIQTNLASPRVFLAHEDNLETRQVQRSARLVASELTTTQRDNNHVWLVLLEHIRTRLVRGCVLYVLLDEQMGLKEGHTKTSVQHYVELEPFRVPDLEIAPRVLSEPSH
jgi:hypothetical protein